MKILTIPKIPWKKLMGSDGVNEKKIEEKREEAHEIKNEMTKDILHIKRRIDRINTNTFNKLTEISADLESVTYNIAIASGGKKRGLK